MDFLLVNDDGYKAKGLRVLSETIARLGDVTVVAPKKPQSAMATSVSLGLKKLAGKPLPEIGPGRWYYLDATPVSCVKFALNYPFVDRKPDVLISGINHGHNASTGSCYSATLGSAEEGAINGIRSFGVSLDSFDADADFSVVAAFLPDLLKHLLENWPKDLLGRGHWVKEFSLWEESVGRLSTEADTFGLSADSDTLLEEGETAYHIVGEFVDDEVKGEDADHRLLFDKWITVTPMTADNTYYSEIERLKGIGLNKDFNK